MVIDCVFNVKPRDQLGRQTNYEMDEYFTLLHGDDTLKTFHNIRRKTKGSIKRGSDVNVTRGHECGDLTSLLEFFPIEKLESLISATELKKKSF